MSDLISRSAMRNAIRSLGEDFINEYKILYLIEHMDDAEPEERTAKVEHVDLNNTQHWVFKCLECGQYFHKTSWGRPVKYCPYCGARLEW